MKIIILQGSPNQKGSTNILVEEFTKGAESSGHTVIRFDVAAMNIKPCIGCVACGYEGPCVQKDDNQKIREAILSADMIVFATPLYYYGMSAQLKIVIDRFCAYNSSITRKNMKSALLTVAWNSDGWTFDALEASLPDTSQILGFRRLWQNFRKRLWKSGNDQTFRLFRNGVCFGKKLKLRGKCI